MAHLNPHQNCPQDDVISTIAAWKKGLSEFLPTAVLEIAAYFNQIFAHFRLHVHTLFVDVTMRTDSPKMTDVEPVVSNFASSARAGRRNAVPDIQGSTAVGGTLEELPVKLEALSVKEDVKKKDEETAQDQLEKPKDEGK
ncbi:hypothetical protein MJG53_008819 [Ovis ammon polii x Ovis aries]|uniref:Uncharacterized protein n=1 Tax=Ovis ammon polii x Ovis aries TaxID=2918886 RepID=A0ACB9UXN8_9CETA|nr:hypothetical protein MJT46_008451 [Ovis ammon polii x Ovis aries]KAI4582268.1 hypothetical protein MJG53_008819 [Ovis ammon polii x Ovis aries]